MQLITRFCPWAVVLTLAALAPPLSFAAGAPAAPSSVVRLTARAISFDESWRFHLGDITGGEGAGLDDSAWRTLDLPHDWSIENLPNPDGDKRSGPFDKEASAGQTATGWVVGGTAWYRKHFRLPALAADRRVEIRFDGVYMDSEVWVNGQRLGNQPYGYSSFSFDLTPHLRRTGENVLAVRVRNEGKNSRWYSGSGIYRHVWLTVTGPLRLPLWGVFITTPEVAPANATVNAAIEVANESDKPANARVRVRLLDPQGRPAGSGEARVSLPPGGRNSVSVKLRVSNPRLWSPSSPSLYRAAVEVVRGSVVADRIEQRFGIRTIEIDAEHGLRINGTSWKMKGACVHHDNGPLGAVAIDRAEERRVEILKAAGFDAIRTSHNPPSPAFLDAADRLGMLVIDEAFDQWQRPKNPQDYHRFFDEWWARDLSAMVKRDRNHPSVVIWSIGNEVNERADASGVEIAKRLIAAVRADDATRPITNAICSFWDHKGRQWTDTDAAFDLLDVGGYNYLWKEYEKDHERAPRRVMAATESTTLEAFDYWSAVERLPYLIGDFVWTGLDYLGEAGLGRAYVVGDQPDEFNAPWPWFIAGSGDIDILGYRKPQSFYREALWRPNVLHLTVRRPLPEGRTEKVTMWGWPLVESHWTWPGQERKPLTVAVYSSCQRVKLSLNGRAIGEKPTGAAERHMAEFEVPYEAGTLTAACAPNGPVASLATARVPARLRLSADRTALRANANDLSYVRIDVVDAKGTIVPSARPAVRARVTGPGELAALASADPVDISGFKEPERRPFQGVLQAIVRPKRAGTIELVVEADGLPPARVAITAR